MGDESKQQPPLSVIKKKREREQLHVFSLLMGANFSRSENVGTHNMADLHALANSVVYANQCLIKTLLLK